MQGSASPFDEGRFGPVYRSHDPETNRPVLVRVFAQALTLDELDRLVAALTRLCETPLDHPAIARPLAAGIADGRPFLTQTLLPGVSLQRFLAEHGPQPFADVVRRVTQLAAAIDLAAAAGIHHGDLGAGDVIVAPEATGISGFGIMQALNEAGILPNSHTATLAGDVRALAGIALDLLQGAADGARDVRSLGAVPGADQTLLHWAFSAGLETDPHVRPATALEFAAALQEASVEASLRPVEMPDVHLEGSPDGNRSAFMDLPLRTERGAATVEQVLSLAAVPSPAAGGPLPRDVPLADAPERERPEARSVPAAPMSAPIAPDRAARDRNDGGSWFLGSAALAIGLLCGFAAGFVVGQRGGPVPTPRVAAEALRPDAATSAAPAPATGDDRRPESAAGGADSAPADSGIRIPDTAIESRDLEPRSPMPEPAAEPASPRTTQSSPAVSDPLSLPGPDGDPSTASLEPRTPNAGPRLPAPGSRAQNPGAPANNPGALQVLSRPAGAQVFVNGELVGRTPLVIAPVQAGSHDVRIELPGHRRWATSVRVEPGAQARVAASLEQ